jgi:hypothetical protein
MPISDIAMLLGGLVCIFFSILCVMQALVLHFGSHRAAYFSIKEALQARKFRQVFANEICEMSSSVLHMIVLGGWLFLVGLVVIIRSFIPIPLSTVDAMGMISALSGFCISMGLVTVVKKEESGIPPLRGRAAVISGSIVIFMGLYLLAFVVWGIAR